MTKKNLLLVTLLVVLGGIYVYFFTDWFATKDIQIYHSVRPEPIPGNPKRPNPVNVGEGNTVVFGFSREYRFTSIKVVPASAVATNRFTYPIWHLVSESNSVPMKSFAYGDRIRGMKFKVPGDEAEPLEPGVKYRLFIEVSEGAKGEYDFQTTRKQPGRR